MEITYQILPLRYLVNALPELIGTLLAHGPAETWSRRLEGNPANALDRRQSKIPCVPTGVSRLLSLISAQTTTVHSNNLAMPDTSPRSDGREATDLREIRIVYERLDRVDGSARFSVGAPAVYTLYNGTDVQ